MRQELLYLHFTYEALRCKATCPSLQSLEVVELECKQLSRNMVQELTKKKQNKRTCFKAKAYTLSEKGVSQLLFSKERKRGQSLNFFKQGLLLSFQRPGRSISSTMPLTLSTPSASPIQSQKIPSLTKRPGSLPASHPSLAKGEAHCVESQGSLLLLRPLLLFSTSHLLARLVTLPSHMLGSGVKHPQICRASFGRLRSIFNSSWSLGRMLKLILFPSWLSQGREKWGNGS